VSIVPFTAETYQNEFLPVGGSEVHAIVTVTSSGAAGEPGERGAPADSAEIVIVDTSGSMAGRKLRAAAEATRAAIDCIRDGVSFAVIAGTDRATLLYPSEGGLASASEETRARAKTALSGLSSGGGTAIGAWLTLANDLFTIGTGIRHAILLTDGKNESETDADLDRALAVCEGRFQCDCRGVGTDWEVAELRRVSQTLLGGVDIVAEPSGLEADFRAMVERAMGRQTADVAIRLWTPRGAEVLSVKEVSPDVEDLTARTSPHDPSTVDYPTGAWGNEARDYHVAIRVTPRDVGEEMLAGRISLVVGDELLCQALVRAVWTEDEQLSTRISPEVAHYSGQAELAAVIQEGLEARKAGDEPAATILLGRAVQLAAESGNEGTLQLLEQVVEVEDAATGTVQLKSRVDDADEMALDTRSTRSVRVQR
jgi:hypothetical protein